MINILLNAKTIGIALDVICAASLYYSGVKHGKKREQERAALAAQKAAEEAARKSQKNTGFFPKRT